MSFKKLFVFLGILFFSGIATLYTEAAAPCGYGYQPCPKIRDIARHLYQEAIQYGVEQGFWVGYEDKTFKPDNTINRAEFVKILIEALFGTPSNPSEDCFPDVPKNEWFAKYVCDAVKRKILKGYPDGSFKPANNINFVEVAKILGNSFALSVEKVKEGEEWFIPFVVALSNQKAIPETIQKLEHQITRGEMTEFIMRLKEKLTSRPSLNGCDLVQGLCVGFSFSGFGDEFMPKVDMKQVRQVWLQRYNAERRKLNLHDYVYNNALNRSAYIWSQYSKTIGEITHKRPGQTEYYDYNLIAAWFKNLGLDFENIYGVTFTENIGGGSYVCTNEDCTQTLINAIQSTYDAYLAEKDKQERSHYNSMMNKYFNEIGLGIAIDESKKKYYLTVHYGTRLK